MTEPFDSSARASPATGKARQRLLTAARLLLLIALIFAANKGAGWLAGQLDPEALIGHQKMVFGIVAATLLLYAVLMAVPFVPGIEIGLGLFVLLGAQMAPFVYLGTLTGLSLAFFIGRLMPMRQLERLFSALSLDRGASLSARLAPLSQQERLDELVKGAPRRWVPFLLRHRYLALAIAVNVPGNSLVGGGGGICLLAGMSGLFRFSAFLLTLVIAVAPVPILVFFFGPEIFWP